MPVYPHRLAHAVPGWVKLGEVYHIRIRAEPNSNIRLTDEPLARALLDSARYYHECRSWNCLLFLLMPDHVHALMSFPADKPMSTVIAAWKSYQTKQYDVPWQANFFDHRIRSRKELDEKAAYIRSNPVVKNLCAYPEEWPWIFYGDP